MPTRKTPAEPDGKAVLRYTERFAGVLREAGLPRMPALVFVCLYASEAESLSAAELAERLGVSLASISGAVRMLTGAGIIVRERPAGERQDRFRVDADVWLNIMRSRDVALARWEEQIRAGIEVAGPDSVAGRRLAESLAFFDFMRRELTDMLRRWEATGRSGA
ncbi:MULTISPECIES: GbsR/MarR family transcriptional regulator [Parafrankia]|uniref:MarR family transcriptional regulator n=1 Tax=Parafrankia soli TaxID=2599596 RepID=A0A1S1Q215_9ACTN|nr:MULTISPECIES: MarR family transcriptional regulator [Parafrankia]OHV27636.1 MarR family transcriptional regulator [Parafrankia soli]CAI7979735.1 MarR family transcriptional regulator [Frankia sp. Hr75.2]SQD99467.1 putative transcriptional regulator [Parafrankia sp. Ea1.12]